MKKLDKVIKGLNCEEYNKCSECPYVKFGKCNVLLMRDAKELLKKQAPKPVWYETNSMTGLPICHCPSCNEVIKPYAYGDVRKAYYCQYCGQAVKWE